MPNKKLAKGLPRYFEIILAICGLIVALPFLAVFAILIKMSSRGPVLFRQQRVGQGGRNFTLIKLRTMAVTNVGPKITASDDRRVTGIGKLLRKAKIDEFPELWNVLCGEMSFVGPRPEVPEFVELSDPLWQEILSHRPGITDPVTLRLRNEEHLLARVTDKEKYYREIVQPYKMHGYAKFVRDKSWKTDLRIIGRTLKAVVLPRTATPPTADEMKWSLAESVRY
jgi:lipopolysaccharide/colanic/teichoic acid biosynthesis glycosyltransferase